MLRIVRIFVGTLIAVVFVMVIAGAWFYMGNARQDLHVALIRDPSEPGVFIEVVTSSGGNLCIRSQNEYAWDYGLVWHRSQGAMSDIIGECQSVASAQPDIRRLDLRQAFDADVLAKDLVCAQIFYGHVGSSDFLSKLVCE